MLEEAEISNYVTNAHEESEVAVATTLSTRIRTAEGCNKERLIEVRSEAMRPCYGIQVTKQSQPRDMEWQLSCSHWRAVIIGTGREMNDDSLGTCGDPKK